MRNTYSILIGKLVGRYHLKTPGADIKIDLKEIGREWVDWIHVTQNRNQWRALVNTVMNLQVPQEAGNFSN
jgi:hypothetical protein